MCIRDSVSINVTAGAGDARLQPSALQVQSGNFDRGAFDSRKRIRGGSASVQNVHAGQIEVAGSARLHNFVVAILYAAGVVKESESVATLRKGRAAAKDKKSDYSQAFQFQRNPPGGFVHNCEQQPRDSTPSTGEQ